MSVAAHSLAQASESRVDTTRPSVLMVDDQPARLLTYESILEGVGVQCVRALSGREALDKLLKQTFAVILLDVSMPEMDGFETARLIREHPRFEHTPIIFVTGVHISQLDALRGYEVGAIDYIAVPVVPEILRSKVALLVELYKRRADLEALNRELNVARARLDERHVTEQKRIEAELATDLRHTRLLRDLAARMVVEGDVSSVFEEIVAAAMTITESDGGTIQLLDESTNELVFAARRGLELELTSQFERVNASSHSPCGLALAKGERVFVDFDVPESEDPDGSARLHFQYGLRSAQSTPLISRSGRPLGMFSTHWRERRRLDDRELRFLDLLARQAADLIERMRTEQALREADRRKDEFIAMLAHELRNPLVPIRTGVELLKSARAQPGLVDSIRPMMERQIGHMVRLIDDLLDVSRITSGRIELQRQHVTLASVVGSAVEANREGITAGQLDLTVNLSEPLWGLDVDPTRFAQVISNLLQNATKFTPPGGRIAVRGTIEVSPGSDVPQLVLSVTDSGIGISEAMLPRVFDLFASSDARAQASQGGLGIGLALARRLMEMHGGTIGALSEGIGRGSEFTIRMSAPRAEVARHEGDIRHARTLEGVRVLVIDDNKDAADIMALLVQEMGGLTRVAYDGSAGLAALADFTPAIVLLDIGMPGMDGYETCRRIRHQLGAVPGLVALTGWGQEQDKRQATEAGFDAHLTKPADPQRLEEVMRALSRRTA